jgi:hypothetical protein
MKSRTFAILAVLGGLCLFVARVVADPRKPAAEYFQHLSALGQLTVAVAKAMPPGEYAFKPDPPSMSFGEQF